MYYYYVQIYIAVYIQLFCGVCPLACVTESAAISSDRCAAFQPMFESLLSVVSLTNCCGNKWKSNLSQNNERGNLQSSRFRLLPSSVWQNEKKSETVKRDDVISRYFVQRPRSLPCLTTHCVDFDHPFARSDISDTARRPPELELDSFHCALIARGRSPLPGMSFSSSKL